MAEPQNLANAAVIIAAVYFMFQSGFNWWMAALILWGLATWAHWHQTEDQKKLVRLGIEEVEVRTQNMKMATAVATANLKVIMRNLQ